MNNTPPSPPRIYCILCPHCSAQLNCTAKVLGKCVRCLSCGHEFVAPELILPGVGASGSQLLAETNNPAIDTAGFPKIDTSQPAPKKKVSDRPVASFSFQRQLPTAALFAVVVGLAHLLGRYWPIFGGFFNAVAEPGSPIRNHFMLHHWIAGSVTGLVVCLAWLFVDSNILQKGKAGTDRT